MTPQLGERTPNTLTKVNRAPPCLDRRDPPHEARALSGPARETRELSDADFVRASEARFPMPDGEIKRLGKRLWILRLLTRHANGAEIGLFRGHVSAQIGEIARPRHLYMIDPWSLVGATFGWGDAYTCFGTLPTALARDEARARVAAFPETEITRIEGYFPACIDRIAAPPDAACLDTGHRHDSTRRDSARSIRSSGPTA